MAFSDIYFIYVFLPVFLLLYWITPRWARTILLLAASLVFYTVGSLDQPGYIILLLATVLITYFAARWLDKAKNHRDLIALGALALLGGALLFFKYTDFLLGSAESIFNALGLVYSFPRLGLLLPLGLSFYIFQATAYLADVYNREYKAETNLIRFSAYLTMFPYVLSGPLVSYPQIRRDMCGKKLTFHSLAEGLRLVVIGLGFKVVLAGNIGGLWREITKIGYDSISPVLAWLALWAYSFQLYFDFYGYSLIAKGLGGMLGFRIPDNFREPYTATSMTDFWRRWHITLGAWFKKYIYIPLGGNRVGKVRNILNLAVVWCLTGLWHGAGVNFILWGLLLCVVIVLEKFLYKKYLDRFPVLGHAYMLVLIPVFWAIFAIEDAEMLGIFFAKLFPFLPNTLPSIEPTDFIRLGKDYILYFIVAAVFCTSMPRRIYEKYKDHWIISVLLVAVFGVTLYCICMGLNDPFMYFRF